MLEKKTRGSDLKKKIIIENDFGYLLVVIEQEAFHNQDVRLLLGLAHIICRGEVDAMGTGELYRVLNPASYRVGHCLHVQSCDHCGGTNRKWQKQSAV